MTCAATGSLPLIEFGVASIAAPGETESGDLHVVVPTNRGLLMGVVDGLGHGEEAATAARAAVEVLEAYPNAGVAPLVRRCHDRLKGTRGVVMTLVAFDGANNTITSLGVGNIEGLLLGDRSSSGSKTQSILLRPGVVGYRLPQLQPVVEPVACGDLLILFTDGIRNEFGRQFDGDTPCGQIADQIASTYHRGTDDTLVLVARYRGKRKNPSESEPAERLATES